MIDAQAITPDTWITLGSAGVVVVAAIKGTMVLVNIQRDLRGILHRKDFSLWAARLKAGNPNLNVPRLDSTANEGESDDS